MPSRVGIVCAVPGESEAPIRAIAGESRDMAGEKRRAIAGESALSL
jgi:hypothetical protein